MKGDKESENKILQVFIFFLLYKGDEIMYNNPYIYSQQANVDRLNEQINNLERMKAQIQQPPVQQPITQNFQLAPTNRDVIRYATSIDEVQRDMVLGDTPYFSKDMSVVWVKNTKGEIKTYELNEITLKDEKDIKIDFLMAQIEELKKEMKSNESNANINESSEDEESSNVQTVSKSSKKSK